MSLTADSMKLELLGFSFSMMVNFKIKLWRLDRLRNDLADRLLGKVEIAFDPYPERPIVLLELVQAECPPFVVPVAENSDVTKEAPALWIIFGRIPRTRTGGVEELGNDDGILDALLPSDLSEPPLESLGE